MALGTFFDIELADHLTKNTYLDLNFAEAFAMTTIGEVTKALIVVIYPVVMWLEAHRMPWGTFVQHIDDLIETYSAKRRHCQAAKACSCSSMMFISGVGLVISNTSTRFDLSAGSLGNPSTE